MVYGGKEKEDEYTNVALGNQLMELKLKMENHYLILQMEI